MSADELRRELGRIDALLQHAVEAATERIGHEHADDPHRGLYIREDDVRRLLGRPPAEAAFGPWAQDLGSPGLALRELGERFGLSPFELGVVALTLAPEVDLRYERLFAFLQDDVTQRRPTVELALDLLCQSLEDKLASRCAFEAGAPLIEHRIVRLAADPGHIEPPLLALALKLDEQILRVLLGTAPLDARLAAIARLDAGVDGEHADPRLAELVRAGGPLRLYLHGARPFARHREAAALAAAAGMPLLSADLRRPGGVELAGLAAREARLQRALLFVPDIDALGESDRAAVMRALEGHDGPVLLGGDGPAPPAAVAADSSLLSLPVRPPAEAARRRAWQAATAGADPVPSAADLDLLAGVFRLTEGEIGAAARRAFGRARLASGGPALADFCDAAHELCASDVTGLARQVPARRRWRDLVLPRDRTTQLQELCDRVRHRATVFDRWGFDRRLSLGKGVTALFAGPPGTGKTLAAEIVAGELGLQLYKVDLAAVVSKYIGETEKNLSRIFDAAQAGGAILFFDEADALFGRRTEVREAHDRYANIEVGYLLQRMDEFEGAVILATNLRKNLDEAFARRLQVVVDFPFPDEALRRRIWASIWPSALPRGELDLDRLARQFELAGGSIRNVALGAAFLAAADGGVVSDEHVLRATRREYHKLGKVLTDAELEAMGAGR